MAQNNNSKKIIKVGYLVSYDYEYIFNSLKETYAHSDLIVLSYDKNFQTWSGNTFVIPDSFFEEIKKIDVDNKISFHKDAFYVENLDGMASETRQRNMLGEFMGKGGWHIQIDSDEYPYDFKKLTDFLHSNKFLLRNAHKNPVNFLAKWVVLFKKDENGIYIIKPFEETCYLVTNYPKYSYARRTIGRDFVLNYYTIHQSWARSEDEIYTKLTNWGHKNDFDTMLFFENWKNLNKNNYQEFENFHPLTGEAWKKLEYQEAKSIDEFTQIYKEKLPQNEIKLKFTKRAKLFLKSIF